VIITCPQCRTQYRYDEARFGASKQKRVKCPKCETVFQVENPEPEPEGATRIGFEAAASPEQKPAAAPEAAELPQLAPIPKDVRVSLAVIAGAQAGTVFPITKPRIYLGRGSSMDVQLKDAEVSRKHAMIEIRGEAATLADMGTTNGTFVGGERIDRVELANQNEFTLGSTTLMLIITLSRDTSV
jgi:predicted Zn finger-like uncharacterized protein